jgi:hypothetical protein
MNQGNGTSHNGQMATLKAIKIRLKWRLSGCSVGSVSGFGRFSLAQSKFSCDERGAELLLSLPII